MMDITGRKLAEAQLAEAEARYRTLVEQTPTITYIAAIGEASGHALHQPADRSDPRLHAPGLVRRP